VDTPRYVRQETVSQQVRVALARNHPAAAELALQREGFSFHDHFGYPELLPDQVIPHSIGLLYNSSLCLLLQQARTGNDSSRLTDGIELAGKLISGALKGKYIPVALEALLLRAQIHAALGDTPSSRADFLAALEMGEPEGFIGVFIDQGRPVAEALTDLSGQNIHDNLPREYIERILAAFRQSLPAQPPGTAQGEPSAAGLLTGKEPTALAEPLTNRERDVLRLMAAGLKYKEIAAELFISLNTVRFHVKAIYGKLHVNNRTQAIQAARQYRIL